MRSVLVGLFVPFVSDASEGAEDDDWLILRLVVRSIGMLWMLAGLLIATIHEFVRPRGADVPSDS